MTHTCEARCEQQRPDSNQYLRKFWPNAFAADKRRRCVVSCVKECWRARTAQQQASPCATHGSPHPTLQNPGSPGQTPVSMLQLYILLECVTGVRLNYSSWVSKPHFMSRVQQIESSEITSPEIPSKRPKQISGQATLSSASLWRTE